MKVVTFSHKKNHWLNRIYALRSLVAAAESRPAKDWDRVAQAKLFHTARKLEAAYERGKALMAMLAQVPYKEPRNIQGQLEYGINELVDSMTLLNDIAAVLHIANFPKLHTRSDIIAVGIKKSLIEPASPAAEEALESLKALITKS